MDRASRAHACFLAILRFDDMAGDLEAAEGVYAYLTEQLDALLAQATNDAQQSREAHAMAYAIVALADEAAMRADASFGDFWMPQTLQVRYFQEHAAGEQFFVRLEALLSQDSASDVIAAYHTALALGFEGRFAHAPDGAGTQAMRAQTAARLGQAYPPHADALHVDTCKAAYSDPAEAAANAQAWRQDRAVRRAWRLALATTCAAFVVFVLARVNLAWALRPLVALAEQSVGGGT